MNDYVPKEDCKECKRKGMEYAKGKWTKYSNKWFPRYVREHWTVWETNTKGVGFYTFENAVIYQKLLELTSKVSKQSRPTKEEEGLTYT